MATSTDEKKAPAETVLGSIASVSPGEYDVQTGVTKADAESGLTLALQQYVPGTDAEKRLVRKIDFILIPALWWFYILAYIDRGNVVSAK
jgi:hypothetical protein